MSMQPAGFKIATSCPGCGASVDFGADFFVTQCDHCRSPLRLIVPHHSAAFYFKPTISEREERFAIDRFCKVQGEPLPNGLMRKRILFPYWNLDGILLKIRNEIERREVVSEIGDTEAVDVVETPRQRVTLTPFSTTIPAAIYNDIPASIGLRTKYMTLYPLAADKLENGVTCIPINRSAEQAIEQAAKISQALSQTSIPDFGKNSNRLFPLSASLIFFPYAIYESTGDKQKRSFVVDLLSGDVTKGTANIIDENEVTDTEQIFPGGYQVHLTFHRCPNCGNALPQEQSLVYMCTHCDERIAVENGIPGDIRISLAEANASEPDIWFPFWVLAGSEKRILPAFRSGNYEAMFRLSQRMSGGMAHCNWAVLTKAKYPMFPVQVPFSEALALFQASLARQAAVNTGRNTDFTVTEEQSVVELLFVPFHRDQYFYIDSCLKAVTFEQAAVKPAGREPAVKSRV